MLSTNDAQLVRNAVNRELFNDESIFSVEDAAQMQSLPGTRMGASITVLAIQYGDLTIMTWVQFTEHGMRVRKVHSQAW